MSPSREVVPACTRLAFARRHGAEAAAAPKPRHPSPSRPTRPVGSGREMDRAGLEGTRVEPNPERSADTHDATRVPARAAGQETPNAREHTEHRASSGGELFAVAERCWRMDDFTRDERNRLIRELRDKGWSHRRIGKGPAGAAVG